MSSRCKPRFVTDTMNVFLSRFKRVKYFYNVFLQDLYEIIHF